MQRRAEGNRAVIGQEAGVVQRQLAARADVVERAGPLVQEITEVLRGHGGLIDDADAVLEQVFKEVTIDAITMTGQENNESKGESNNVK